jgi:hypothetical protein
MRTREDAELVAQGKSLEQEVSTRRPGRSDRSTRPDDGSHRPVECRPGTPTSMTSWLDAILARHSTSGIAEFVEHYHCERNHQGLDNRLIAGTPVTDRTGHVRCRRRLGRLLNFYERAA